MRDSEEDGDEPDGRNSVLAAMQEVADEEGDGGKAAVRCRALAFVASPNGPLNTKKGCSRAVDGLVNCCGQITLRGTGGMAPDVRPAPTDGVATRSHREGR